MLVIFVWAASAARIYVFAIIVPPPRAAGRSAVQHGSAYIAAYRISLDFVVRL